VPESQPRDAVTLTRRTTVAAVPLLALTACRWGPEDDTSPEVEQAQDADAGLVTTAAEAITRVSLDVTSAAEDHIGLASALAPLSAIHLAHLQLLDVTVEVASIDTGEPDQPDSRSALAAIRAQEALLQTQLADLASTAVSGTLARALASMSASIAQHLAVLPDIARGPA
jgi:hypothetical protein